MEDLSKDMEQKEPAQDVEGGDTEGALLDITFRVSERDYFESSFLIGSEFMQKRAPRTKIFGALFLAVGALLIAMHSRSGVEVSIWQALVIGISLILGLFNLFYYPFYYKRVLRGTSKRIYARNAYLQNDIHITFYSDRIREQSAQGDHTLPWSAIRKLYETRNLYIFKLSDTGAIFVPKAEIPDKVERLGEILRDAQDLYGVMKTTVSTPIE